MLIVINDAVEWDQEPLDYAAMTSHESRFLVPDLIPTRPYQSKKEALHPSRGIPPLVQTDNFAWPRGVLYSDFGSSRRSTELPGSLAKLNTAATRGGVGSCR